MHKGSSGSLRRSSSAAQATEEPRDCADSSHLKTENGSTPQRRPPFSAHLSRMHPSSNVQGSHSSPTIHTIPGQFLVIDSKDVVRNFLACELDVSKLNDIHRHLWMVGRKQNLHPLHWQKMMKRDISITECPTLHLVWHESTIYIKPLPDCLIDFDFFTSFICPNEKIYKEACGFLLTYAHLIVHKSDFHIAHDLHLLPDSMDWEQWGNIRLELLRIREDDINERYQYGELRLARLNLVYMLFCGRLAYHHVYRDYNSFFSKQFAWLLLVFAYATVILTAMQIMIATPNPPSAVSDVSFWFAVTTALVVGIGSIGPLLCLEPPRTPSGSWLESLSFEVVTAYIPRVYA